MINQNILTQEIRELLTFSPLQYMLDTVVENPKLAHIYTDKELNPTCCVLLFGHYLWVAGNVAENTNDIASILNHTSLDVLIVFYDNSASAMAIKAQYMSVYDNVRSLYKQLPKVQDYNYTDRIMPISKKLLQSGVNNIEMIADEVEETATYDSIETFCQIGIGFTYVIDNEVCAFCTSEYQSKSSIAIGIEVNEKYQCQGIASDMVHMFLQEAAKRQLEVYWDCWQKNEPSVRTALKCGFSKVIDYPVLFIDMSNQ